MEIEDLTPLAQKLINAITDSEGVQRLPSEESRLVAEKAELPIFFAHFLGELPNHATMLSVALADGYSSLVKLGAKLPFGSNAVARPDFHRWWGVGWCLCRSGVRGVGVRGTSLVGILTMWPRSSVV